MNSFFFFFFFLKKNENIYKTFIKFNILSAALILSPLKEVRVSWVNYIWWWGSSSGTLGECGVFPLMTLLSGPLWPGVVVPIKFPSVGQINLFKSYSYLIELCARKKKSQKMKIEWMQFSNFYAWNNPRWVEMLLKSIGSLSNLM